MNANDQSRIKVSQNTAILIEAARSSGLSDETLLHEAKSGNIEAFQGIAEGELDFHNLIENALENPDKLEQAVRHGYQITFNTINGMKYYIGLTYGKLRERDYPNLSDRIEGLKLRQEELDELRLSLSPYWIITETAREEQQDRITVSITGQQSTS